MESSSSSSKAQRGARHRLSKLLTGSQGCSWAGGDAAAFVTVGPSLAAAGKVNKQTKQASQLNSSLSLQSVLLKHAVIPCPAAPPGSSKVVELLRVPTHTNSSSCMCKSCVQQASSIEPKQLTFRVEVGSYGSMVAAGGRQVSGLSAGEAGCKGQWGDLREFRVSCESGPIGSSRRFVVSPAGLIRAEDAEEVSASYPHEILAVFVQAAAYSQQQQSSKLGSPSSCSAAPCSSGRLMDPLRGLCVPSHGIERCACSACSCEWQAPGLIEPKHPLFTFVVEGGSRGTRVAAGGRVVERLPVSGEVAWGDLEVYGVQCVAGPVGSPGQFVVSLVRVIRAEASAGMRASYPSQILAAFRQAAGYCQQRAKPSSKYAW